MEPIKIKFFNKKYRAKDRHSEFDLQVDVPNKKKIIIKKIRIPLLGIHNINNSAAATAVAIIGLSISDIKWFKKF